MKAETITTLSQTPLFAGIAPDVLSSVLACLQPKIVTYSKNAYIAIADDDFTGLGVLLSGKATIIKENGAGSRIVMGILGSGDLFGEMIAFSNRKHWPVSVVAQTDCSVMFIPTIKITHPCAQVCDSHKQLIDNMLRILSEKALHLNRKVEYLALKGMREKISRYLLEQYKVAQKNVFTINLNRNDMADFLNVSRTALSRELGRMRDDGLIDFYRSSIKITNLDGLRQAAG